MTAPVFIAPDLAHVATGDHVDLTGDEAHHAATVMRLGPQAPITVVNGQGLRVEGTVVRAADDRVVMRAENVVYESPRELVLVQALAKDRRDEQAIESATELGVTRIIPWAAERSVSVWKGAKRDKARQRWRNLVVKATKQSRRATLPHVEELASTTDVIDRIREAVASGAQVAILHEEARTGIRQVEWHAAQGPGVWLVVGPEGGIAAEERALFAAAGAQEVRLGPHVVRSSTAGPAAVSIISVLSGLWDVAEDAQSSTTGEQGGLR